MKIKLLIAALLTVVGVFLVLFLLTSRQENHMTSLTLNGNVDIRQVDVGFRVFGRVSHVHVDEGDEVLPGDLLAELDPTPYEAQKNQWEAQAAGAKTQLENARTVYKRRHSLVNTGAVSQEDYTNALASQEELDAHLAQALAGLQLVEVSLADTKLYAPTRSTVLTRIREPGSVLNVGEPLLTLSILSPVWIRTYVSEPLLGLVYPGMAAEVHTDTPHGKVYRGRLGFISPVAEFTPKNVETTALRPDLVYRLRIIVDDPDYALKRGMPVTVKLLR